MQAAYQVSGWNYQGELFDGGGAGFGDGVVLFAAAAGDADGADDLVAAFEGDASGEDHDAAVVGDVDAVEVSAGLGELGEGLGVDVEGAGGEGLVDGDVDAAKPGTGHAGEGKEVSAGADDGNVHGLAEGSGFFLGGGDDLAGFFEGEGVVSRHGRLLCVGRHVSVPRKGE